MMTSPPRPPLPPQGPPNSMYFSRRNATQPLPPLPDAIYTLATSRNFMLVTRTNVAALLTQRSRGFAVGAEEFLRARRAEFFPRPLRNPRDLRVKSLFR